MRDRQKPIIEFGMSANNELLAEIDAYLARTGVSEKTFGAKLGDWRMVPRLRAGGSVTLPKAERVREFLRSPPVIIPKRRASAAADPVCVPPTQSV